MTFEISAADKTLQEQSCWDSAEPIGSCRSCGGVKPLRGPGLYVHVPFCVRRCPYCDFYSVSALDLIPRYVEALGR
jgi:coproporphyrinogen III oxidase-like Fe-S oxidoreductase